MNTEIENKYEQRAEMNQVCSLVLKFLGFLYETDLVILIANYKPKEESKSEAQKLKEQYVKKFDKFHDRQKKVRQETKKTMRQMKNMLVQLIAHEKAEYEAKGQYIDSKPRFDD